MLNIKHASYFLLCVCVCGGVRLGLNFFCRMNRMDLLDGFLWIYHKKFCSFTCSLINLFIMIKTLFYFIWIVKILNSNVLHRPSGCLDSYLECLQKVKSSIDFFTENSGDCPELDELVSLFLLNYFCFKFQYVFVFNHCIKMNALISMSVPYKLSCMIPL